MLSILEEFAYQNISSKVQLCDKDSRISEAARLLADMEHKLLERPGTDNKDLFQKYIAAQDEANQLTASQNFVYGYRLGVAMTAEALIGIDVLYSGREEF